MNIFKTNIRFYKLILPIYEKYSDMLDLAVAGRLWFFLDVGRLKDFPEDGLDFQSNILRPKCQIIS